MPHAVSSVLLQQRCLSFAQWNSENIAREKVGYENIDGYVRDILPPL